ncbi:MAG: GHMP kinase [Bacillota bacterium]
MYGRAQAPGTCGELVQGRLDGIDFMVTCPVDLWSCVEVSVDCKRAGRREYTSRTKAGQAVECTLARLGQPGRAFSYRVASSIPVGKGMASSSADIAAACVAAARALGKAISAEEVADIALSIEPTDGLMYPGIALFDHRMGRIRRTLGCAPPMDVIIVDPGGTVDTLMFNRRPDLAFLNRKKEREVEEALSLVEQGVIRGDPELIGCGATLSAMANQGILEKPALDRCIRMGRELGAVGVNVAHSGTVIGLLFDRRNGPGPDAVRYASGKLNLPVMKASIIGGGVK